MIPSLFAYGYGGGSSPVTAPRGQMLYVAEGDSITQGYLGTSYPQQYKNEFKGRVNFVNSSQGGSLLAGAVSRAATVDGYLTTTALWRTTAVLSILFGTTDYANGLTTAAFISNFIAYLDARRTAGWKVLVGTLLPRSIAQSGAPFEAWRGTVNAAIRTWVGSHCDGVIDFAASSPMGLVASAEDTSLYQDGLHPSQLGYNYLYGVAKPVLNAFTIAPSSVPAEYSSWSATDKAATLTLSAANYQVGANTSGGWCSVRSTNGREAGKYFVEFLIGGSNDQFVGVVDSVMTTGTYFAGINSCMYFCGAGVYQTSFTILIAVAYTALPGDRIGYAVDFDGGFVYISKNGVYSAGTNPATGANPNYQFPANTMLWLGASENAAANFSKSPASSSDLVYAKPTGYLSY